jgi:hypothetical protein
MTGAALKATGLTPHALGVHRTTFERLTKRDTIPTRYVRLVAALTNTAPLEATLKELGL